MHLIRGSVPSASGSEQHAPALDVAVAHALLARADRGEVGPTVRIVPPAASVVAFGRVDVRRPGFGDAAEACREHGFEPVVRSVGGRAAALTPQSLLVDLVVPEPDPGRRMRRRFEEYGALISGVLADLGVDARVGEVPGEFCPGAYSVNARGAAKLVGTAQRVVRRAWLFSAVVVVDGADRVAGVLSSVYDCLGLPFDPAAVGSVAREVPGIGVETLTVALAAAFGPAEGMVEVALDPETLREAGDLLDEHVVG